MTTQLDPIRVGVVGVQRGVTFATLGPGVGLELAGLCDVWEERLSEAGVEVFMFSQSFSEQNLNLVVRDQDQTHCLNLLCREFGNGTSRDWPGLPANGDMSSTDTFRKLSGVCSLGTRGKVATVSVVGVPGWNDTGIAAHAFSALGKLGARVIAVAQAATEQSMSFCIREDQLADTVRFLHRELGLEGNDE